MPQFELEFVYSHGDTGPWSADVLATFLDQTDPTTLPRAKCLSAPESPKQNTQEKEKWREYPLGPGPLVLPLIENTPFEGILRIDSKPVDRAVTEVKQSRQELLRLGEVGKRHDLGRLILPHSVFISPDDPYADTPESKANYAGIFTVVERVGNGENLRNSLQNPRDQEVLLALGGTLVEYFDEAVQGQPFLADISNHYQFSTSGNLYDISHDVDTSPAALGIEVYELAGWVSELLPSDSQRDLLGRADELKSLHPLADEDELGWWGVGECW